MSATEVSSSPLYADNPDWKDITPLYLLAEEQGAVMIAASDQFYDAFAYFRAVVQKREMSMRVLNLINDCIRLNSANYSVWQYRRDLIKELNLDLHQELAYISEVIEENTKNYQTWHHRRYLVDQIGAEIINEELDFTSSALRDEAKNYHAWQHRHWLLGKFSDKVDIDKEMSFTLKMIMEDPRNNSAWNYRYTLLEKQDAFKDSEKISIETNLCFKLIERMPHNESIWNFLAGISEDVEVEKKNEIISFVEDLYEKTESGSRSPYLISFLGDVLVERIEKEQDVESSHKKAKELYFELQTADPVRKNYWKYMELRVENIFQKHLLNQSNARSRQVE